MAVDSSNHKKDMEAGKLALQKIKELLEQRVRNEKAKATKSLEEVLKKA